MFDNFRTLGWTRLPIPPCGALTSNLRHLCAGCRLPLGRTEAQFYCRFCDTGFQAERFVARPCHTRYHPECIRIGLPFVTRLPKDGGLDCPKDLAALTHYICEACIVRSVLGRELSRNPADLVLLMLERARFIDLTNHWARGTLRTYQSKFNVLRDFETDLQVPILLPTTLLRPPHSDAIKLMWAQERYSLYPAEWRRRNSDLEKAVTFGSIRAIRSAASHFWIWDLLLTQPEKLTLGFKDRPTVVSGCSPTDEIAYTYFTDGMRRRVGDDPKPSAVLLLHHIIWMEKHFAALFANAVDRCGRVDACRAALTLVLAYLAWLRALETFGLTWGDVTVTDPTDGPTLGLPFGIGVIQLKLLAQTKSNQAAAADMIIAYTSASGLPPGRWLQRLRALLRADKQGPDSIILAHPDGRAWTSHFYRYTYLYPLLGLMRSLGDAYLSKYDETPGKELQKAFHGFNTLRRTGRSVASKRRAQTSRAGSSAEVVEHGRWRLSRSSLDMPSAYLQWAIDDRICISQFCL